MKGAPETIIDSCSFIVTADGETKIMKPEDAQVVKKAYTEIGYRGERVLAYCDYVLPSIFFQMFSSYILS